MPYGGVGQSGHGRMHGKAGFEQFSNMKSIFAKRALDFGPFNSSVPPISEGNKNLAANVLRLQAGAPNVNDQAAF